MSTKKEIDEWAAIKAERTEEGTLRLPLVSKLEDGIVKR